MAGSDWKGKISQKDLGKMGLGRKTSTHLSNSCSGAATMSGASFRCFLGASQEGVVTVREWSLKDEAGRGGGGHHCALPPASPASTPVLFYLLAPDCTSLTWTRLLRTVLKYLQLRNWKPFVSLHPFQPCGPHLRPHHLSPTAPSILLIAEVTCHDSAGGIFPALISWVGNTGQCYF